MFSVGRFPEVLYSLVKLLLCSLGEAESGSEARGNESMVPLKSMRECREAEWHRKTKMESVPALGSKLKTLV